MRVFLLHPDRDFDVNFELRDEIYAALVSGNPFAIFNALRELERRWRAGSAETGQRRPWPTHDGEPTQNGDRGGPERTSLAASIDCRSCCAQRTMSRDGGAVRRANDPDARRFVIAEASIAGAMVLAAFAVTALVHVIVFGGVLLLFAGCAFGHALAVHLGIAHPPRQRARRDRRPPR